MFTIFSKLKLWVQRNFGYYVHLDRDHSTVVVSPRLWDTILKDHPSDTQFNVLFSRVSTGYGPKSFAMFFNPEWEKHGITDPHMILTIPVTHSPSGRVGFQSIQPSVELIMTTYGINSPTATLSVRRSIINGEPYYILSRP